VQPRAIDPELADHAGDQLGEQAAPVGQEQQVQHPAGPVVVQQAGLALGKTQQGRLIGRRPLAQGVQRPVLDAQVRHHDRQHRRRVQRQPGIIGRHPAVQQPRQADPAGEVRDQRDGAQPPASDPLQALRARRRELAAAITGVGGSARGQSCGRSRL